MKKKDNYEPVPDICCGLLLEGGIFFTLPFLGISLNEYKKMHFGRVAKLKNFYKSMIDVVITMMVNKDKIGGINENGLFLKKGMFTGQVDVEWLLTFKVKNQRDTANYTQKIFLDAIVWSGIIEDDREKFVCSDKVFFGTTKENTVTCIIRSKKEDQDVTFYNMCKIVSYPELLSSFGARMKTIYLQEDDGEI